MKRREWGVWAAAGFAAFSTFAFSAFAEGVSFKYATINIGHCANGAAEINYHGMKPANVDALARLAARC